MLTREEDVDAHALSRQGWTISAIARHLGRDRKTIRAYLSGDRTAGVRKPPAEGDAFAPFVDYVRERLAEDPHLWAVTLFDELQPLGFDRSYATLTRQIRTRRLRPHCEPCHPAKDRPVAVIEHPPGEETQWDWLELPDPPPGWAPAGKAFLLVGALSHSGRWRGQLCEGTDFAQLVAALDSVSRKLGGLTRAWRFDRMATVVSPNTGRVTAAFAAVAKHYGVQVALCPPRRGNRKGVVEKANHVAAQRWWRTLADDVTVEQAQASLDVWCTRRGDMRMRAGGTGGKLTVATLAAREPLRRPGPAFPAELTVQRLVSAQALVAYEGNFYSVPPELARSQVTVTHRLGAAHIDIAAAGPAGSSDVVLARHQLAPAGAGVQVRTDTHVAALNSAALAAATPTRPHRRKQRIPPGPAAQAAAAALTTPTGAAGAAVVIDLSRYAAAAAGRNTLT
jgi:transposase